MKTLTVVIWTDPRYTRADVPHPAWSGERTPWTTTDPRTWFRMRRFLRQHADLFR